MEVKLDKRYPLDVSAEQAWLVLSDIRAVAGCMPGAAITEQIDATHFKGTVNSRVGPASMKFGGDIEVLGLDAATRSMQLLGKGADRGGSSASMNLAAHLEAGETANSSVLVGQATVIVSGKLAQFGSRLLVPVSDAMLAQFADNFRVAAAAVPIAPKADAAGSGVVAAHAAATAPVGAGEGEVAVAPAPAPAPAPANELNALALMWAVFKAWLAGLFGRKRGG
jgi:uncharacterized protein